MRHVKLWLTTVAVLLCSITKMSGEVVLTEENGLLNTLSANSAGRYQYVYTSPMFTVDEATNTLTFTFLEGYTRSNSLNDPNGYPFVAFSEFYLYDGEGNEVALDASNFSTNAQETREGPIANICDKDRTTFFHSLWSAGASDYHNLVITLPEGMELQEFRFKYYTRWESHGIPKKFSIEASNGEISYGTEVIADGTCGDNLTWELTYDGNLAISGSGSMYDYNYSYVNNTLPWSDYREILKNVTMAEGITTIGCNAFYDCSSLTSITIPEGVTSIGDYAFTHCNELTEVDIPEGVEEIGYRAFLNCYRLPSVLIPKTVYSIGEDAFAYCKNLSSIVVDEENPNYDSRNNCNAIIETNSNTIVRGTANTVIPESVRNIGELAFSGCDFLSSVSIPEGVESIGILAFSQCYSLTTVVIPQSVNSISSRAFYGCNSLSQIKSLAVTPPALQETDVFSGVNKNACTLIVPAGSKAAYQTADGWSEFYRIIEEGEKSDGIILTQADGPLGTLQGSTTGSGIRYYSYTSPVQTLEEATNVLAFTFLEGYTVSGELYDTNDFPFVAFSEFCLYDGEGNEIPLEASNFSTNAQEPTEGPISNICDKNYNTFFHSMWSTGASDYHNLIITLPEGMELKEFSFQYRTRQVTSSWSLHGIPKTISIKTGKDVLAEGICGDNLTWELTYDGNLTISGSGAMYHSNYDYPWYVYRENLRKVAMTEGITTIGEYAFFEYPNLTSVVIPESVVEIGFWAFRQCRSIISLVVDEDNPVFDSRDNCNAIIRTSDNRLIRGCNTTVIPSSVTAIEYDAFFHCEGLTSVDIPEGVERIGSWAFGHCYGLQSVSIPKTVSEIDENAFSYCKNLNSIVVDEENPNYHSSNNCNAIIETETNTLVRGASTTVIPEYVKAIGAYAFSGNEALLSVSLPEGVTSIGEWAFSNCQSLESLSIPEGVTELKLGTFSKCTSLSSISLPYTLTSIGNQAFEKCSSLASVTIPEKVKTIGDFAFRDCSSLASVTIPEGVAELETYTFYNCTSLSSVSLPGSLTSIGDYAFFYCISLASVAIPEKVKTIGEYAFEYCSSLSSPITIPEGVTELKPYTFVRCTNLPSVSLPSSLTLISDYAFSKCANLEEVIIPDGVTHIGYAAFWDCSKLKSITIGKNVKTIDNHAFNADAALEKINCFALTSPQILSSTFYGVNKTTCQLNVFNSAIPAYQSANYWSEFTNIQAIRETVTVSEYGSGTYSSKYALDFSEMEGLKAYAATGYNTRTGVVTLTRMMTAKAGEGLFVKGEPGDYEVLVLEDTDDNTLNMLVGTLENVTVNGTSDDGLYTNYKYTVKEGDAEPLFYQFADGSTQGAGKAYLQIPTAWLASSEAKSISYRFDDGETTGIEEEELSISDSQFSIVYDLYGRRVANPVKGGIYIVNGKKVVY